MNRGLRAAVIGVVFALTLTACAGAPMTEPPTSPPPSLSSPSGAPAPTGEPADVPDARWNAIVDDLAQRGVDGEPTLVSAEAVTWPDGALGCPTPGQSYTQATVDGMRVVVEVGGATYDYRFGTSDTPLLCKQALAGGLRGAGAA